MALLTSVLLILLCTGSGALYGYAATSRRDWLDAGRLRRRIASMIVLTGATVLLMRDYLNVPVFHAVKFPLLWIPGARSLASSIALAAIIVGVFILNGHCALRMRERSEQD